MSGKPRFPLYLSSAFFIITRVRINDFHSTFFRFGFSRYSCIYGNVQQSILHSKRFQSEPKVFHFSISLSIFGWENLEENIFCFTTTWHCEHVEQENLSKISFCTKWIKNFVIFFHRTISNTTCFIILLRLHEKTFL